MLAAHELSSQAVPAITVNMNPIIVPSVNSALLRQFPALGNNAAPSMQNLESLPTKLQLDVSTLDLSDTGGSETGESDTDPIAVQLIEDGGYYAAFNLTIDGVGSDVYLTYVESSWYMSVNTMGGLSWTGVGSSNVNSPSGTYTTASFSDAGSGSVLVSLV